MAWAGGSEGQAIAAHYQVCGIAAAEAPRMQTPCITGVFLVTQPTIYGHRHSRVGWGWQFLHFGSKMDVLQSCH